MQYIRFNSKSEAVRSAQAGIVRPLKLLVFFVALAFCLPVTAEWLEATGSAPIVNGQVQHARDAAREDALRRALMQFGSEVRAQQSMNDGGLVDDYANTSSDATIRRSVVVDEYEWADRLYLKMQVDVDFRPRVARCDSDQANAYKKKVALLGFSLQSTEQAVMGGLENVERGFASALNRAITRQNMVLAYESSQYQLYDELVNAPTGFTQQRTLTKAVDVAKSMGAQFVVSGVIRDLGVRDPDSFSTSYWSRLKRVSGLSNESRRFAVDLFIHDGFSGAIVHQQSFSTNGDWPYPSNEKIGFGSSAFWDTDYGRAVAIMMNDMAAFIGDTLRCQPYMVRISRVDGKTVHFPSGASAGIKPGDKLSLYRTYNFYDADLLAGTELTNLKCVLTVSQVYPGFSSGTVRVEPGRLNIQEDDLLVAW